MWLVNVISYVRAFYLLGRVVAIFNISTMFIYLVGCGKLLQFALSLPLFFVCMQEVKKDPNLVFARLLVKVVVISTILTMTFMWLRAGSEEGFEPGPHACAVEGYSVVHDQDLFMMVKMTSLWLHAGGEEGPEPGLRASVGEPRLKGGVLQGRPAHLAVRGGPASTHSARSNRHRQANRG